MSGSQLAGRSNGSSSSRRGKKTANQSSDKPKQPQRGLGVAQLEKIRLHSQIEEMRMQAYHAMHSSMRGGPPPSYLAYPSSQYGYPNNIMVYGNGRHGKITPKIWMNPSHVYPDRQHYGPPGVATRHFLNNMEDPGQELSNGWLDMAGSSSHNSGDSQDLDLELKL
ncbi:hypothetical protein V2J09_002985 [Rumex salicifolius]